MFSRIVWPALGAGCAAGLVLAFMQIFLLSPIIVHSETFEETASLHHQAPAVKPAVWRSDTTDRPVIHVHSATEAAGEWMPQDGWQRTGYTTLATILAGIGFALMLSAGMTVAGGGASPAAGLAWGIAGFTAIALAPALGLPPELPGSSAAPLLDRQIWWVGTALATAAGIVAIFYGGTRLWLAAGIALIAAPHIIGAPHPHEYHSMVPAEIQGHFVATSLVSAGVFWAVMGSVLGWLRQKQATVR